MSVERMKYVNFVGPIEKLDEFVFQLIIDREIQLEHAFNMVKSFKGLKPFVEDNPYDAILKKLNSINKTMKAELTNCCHSEICGFIREPLDIKGMMESLTALEERLNRFEADIRKTAAEIDENRQILKQLIPLRNLEFDMDELFHLDYLRIRFGKLPLESFKKLDIVLNGLDVIVVPFSSDDREVWISYVMPEKVSERIDNVLSSLYFERVWISDKVKGHPSDSILFLEGEIKRLEHEADRLKSDFEAFVSHEAPQFQKTYNRIVYMHEAFNVRRFAAHTNETFYIVGWMTEKEYNRLSEQLKAQTDITFSAESPGKVRGIRPPTILRNNRFFKPFETIVTMYGIPAHNEMDPTVLVALTYILMFGAMFGDVGQGAVLALAGIFMFCRKKSPLGWVLSCVGASSVIFGFLYGSVFGNEHLLKAIWKAPMDNINQLLILSVGYGAVMIVVAVAVNIINSIKAGDYGRLLFDKNGLAGLVFYGGALILILSNLTAGKTAAAIPVIVVLLVVSLAAMLFKEKLEKLLLKHHGEKSGGSFIEGFFEVFEAVLGFLSNTISFVRVSAFALSHAGLALAVWTLYDMFGGAGRVVVLIIGNLLIIGLEGLIVGIQCLRLQYYELFSRFFSGDGREFKPIRVCGKHEG